MVKEKNIGAGIIYFYLHFVIEVCCFFYLGKLEANGLVLWAIFLSYNFFAFFPQSIIGYFSDSHPNVPIGAIGLAIAAVVIAVFSYIPIYLSLLIICFANGLVHVNGAEVTLRSSNGNLFSSAVFVAGGSFGVISGRLLATTSISSIYIILLVVSAIPFALFAQTYLKKANEEFSIPCEKFNYAKVKKSVGAVIILVVFIVFVRGYMGYGIPTSWNKSTFQTVFLYFTMGIGKALGGLIADIIGVKKTALLSSIIAVPLLMFGDQHMYVSLLGVMFFSMTMSVTLALLVSMLPKNPGLAFGLTTIGLFLGTAPTFFFKLGNVFSNCLIILILTIVSVVIFSFVIRKDEKKNV